MGLLDAVRAELDVLNDVSEELCRQDEKWGVQSHPDLLEERDDQGAWAINRDTFGTTAEAWKQRNDAAVAEGRPVDWTGVLMEEVYEALCEPAGSEELRTELIQVAAVAIQWVLAIDRRSP